jgi:hypothetical protein
MMTQTTRWDAEAVRRRNRHHAADDSAALTSDFLIANPRLTFDLSCTKHRLLKISNRERIAIFCSDSHGRKSPPFKGREKWGTRKSAFKKQCWETQINFIGHFDLERVATGPDDAFVKYLCYTTNGKSLRNVEYLRIKNGKLQSIECYFGAQSSFPSAVSTGQK